MPKVKESLTNLRRDRHVIQEDDNLDATGKHILQQITAWRLRHNTLLPDLLTPDVRAAETRMATLLSDITAKLIP